MFLKLNKVLLIKISLIFFSILTILLYLFLKKNVPGHLLVNEIAFNQIDGIDWVEIYNPTLNNLSLESMYLTDDADNFSKFKIKEQIIVPSNGYALVYGNGYEGELDNSLVANFRISNGETIYLVSQDGKTVVDSLTVVKDEDNTAYVTIGRFPDGSDDIFIMSQDTPLSSNQKDMIKGLPGF